MIRRRHRLSALVVVAPLLPGHETALREAIDDLPRGPGSPFASIEWTHFTRMAVVPALLDGDGEPAAGRSQAYLLFTADFDGSLEQWSGAAAQRIGATMDRIFGHCDRYPGTANPRRFLRFLREYSIPAGFSITSYRASVERIRESLELRRSLREFAVESQALYPSQLRLAWRKRFVT